jgi:hypothetical protein
MSILSLPWWGGVIFFYCQYIIGKWAFRWYVEIKKYVGKIRYRYLEAKKSSILEKAQNLRKQIVQLIID